jgi:predicted AlkP superfamily pyrophosphatase or phosphodiesterase
MSFMVRAALLLLTLSVGPLLGGCAGAPAPSAAAPQQNAVVAAPVGSGGVNQAEHLDKPYVVVVSFDGFRANYLDRIEAPNFRRVIEAGVRAEGLVPVFPSKTFPNHYSIATGMYAENHGLIDNSFYDPVFDATYRLGDTLTVRDARWYGGEPIWVTAERQGMVAGAFFFVGSEAAVSGVSPTLVRNYDGSIPNSTRVATVLEWLRRPAVERPHLVMLYFSDVDDAGHRFGPESAEVEAAVGRVDTALGQLLDGIAALPIAEQVHLVLVSDHGMSAQDTARVEYLDEMVDLDGVRSINAGPYTTLWVGDSARADGIRDALNAGLENARAYRRYEIPERFRYRESDRAGDLLVLAEPGYQVLRRGGRPYSGGAHGYDPDSETMHGIFYAMGPQVRAGITIPAFENVHVYPLVAHLLGLVPNPAADGRLDVLRPILR